MKRSPSETAMPIRVLHVAPYFAPAFVYGGPPRSIHALCKALVAAGVAVDVMTTTANGRGQPLPSATSTPRTFDGVDARYFPIGTPSWLWRAPALDAAVDAEIDRYDVVHVHGLWHWPGWYAAAAARRAGIPYVISPRGMLEPEALAMHRLRKAAAYHVIERRNLEAAALLHATSPREAATLEARRFGPRVFLASNGVDPDAVTCADPAPALRRLGFDPAGRFVLYLGRIHPIKRLDLLAAAAGLLRARDVTIVIAGPDEAGCRAAVGPLFEAAGLPTRWVGPVEGEQKAALLTGARALVLCSDSESFGLSVAEAMAAGTPVVTTDTCPWHEAAAADAGFSVPQTADAIANALDDVLADPPRARAMGARGRALVLERYAWRSAAATIALEYEKLAGRRVDDAASTGNAHTRERTEDCVA
jgi:glycosyltransferase involved in cell wall biosynthesis